MIEQSESAGQPYFSVDNKAKEFLSRVCTGMLFDTLETVVKMILTMIVGFTLETLFVLWWQIRGMSRYVYDCLQSQFVRAISNSRRTPADQLLPTFPAD